MNDLTKGLWATGKFDVSGTATSATSETSDLPTQVALHPAYPNPFNPSTTIRFDLPQVSTVDVAVFDVAGRKVATLLSGQNIAAGSHQLPFDASRLSSGMYLIQLQANGLRLTQKIALVK